MLITGLPLYIASAFRIHYTEGKKIQHEESKKRGTVAFIIGTL